MYGGPGKFGRGGGGGGGRGAKRLHPTFPPAPPQRPLAGAGAGATGGRLSIGGVGARNRQTTTRPAATSSAPEESLSLVPGDPLAFSMIIRLTPDLVDEIKRVEAQGGTARIKFDSNANNPSGNVIDVGGKDFRFTWSREQGDLFDIYEERQSGEDQNGSLVESGCVWRKLNVLRILDESTMNHVKMRSEEAERKLKSRKAIVLDHGNPSVKNQLKNSAAAAADINPRRMPYKQKKELPFKRHKVETTQGGPPKAFVKSGLHSTTTVKGRLSVSPLASPPEQSVGTASPFGKRNPTKSYTSVEEVVAPQTANKEDVASSEKEIPSRTVHAAVQDVSGHKGGLGAAPADLQGMLITLLMENPKGMRLKALEKAIGEKIPNSVKKIEPILKKIATFQAPGRYILKPGMELESFKKHSSESGSSPEFIRDQATAPEPIFPGKATMEEIEEHPPLSSKLQETNLVEKIDIQQHSPDLFGEKKVPDNSKGHAGSSTDSGSDSESESDSSDSDSDSGSQSRSRSRAGSGSGSSSDSDSDVSSSSKEGSDVDVDIMTSDDDKDAGNQVQAPKSNLSSSPIPLRTDGESKENIFGEDRKDGTISDAVDIEKDLPEDDQEMAMVDVIDTVPDKAHIKSLEEIKSLSPDHDKLQGSQQMFHTGDYVDRRQRLVKDGLIHEQSDSSERISRPKSKRGADLKLRSEGAKRLKEDNSAQKLSGNRNTNFAQSPKDLSLDRPHQDTYKDETRELTERVDRDRNVGIGSQKGHSLSVPGGYVSDAQQFAQMSVDSSACAKAPDGMEKPGKYVECLAHEAKYSHRSSNFLDESDVSAVRSFHTQDKFPVRRDKMHRESQGVNGSAYEKSLTKTLREEGAGDRHSVMSESHCRKHGEQNEKFSGQMMQSQIGSFPKDNNRTDADTLFNGKERILRREPSELELGELREPNFSEETQGVKKQFERKSSFKQSERKSKSSDNWNLESSKGRVAGKAFQDSRKKSPSDLKVGVLGNQESSLKKRTPEDDLEDSTRPLKRVANSQSQQLASVDHINAEVGSQSNKLGDVSNRSRKNDARSNQDIGLEGFGSKKAPVLVPQQHNTKHPGRMVAPHTAKETKNQKSGMLTDLSDKQDTFWMESVNHGGKRRGSSSDEDNSSYSKYEKEEPELKGPIKDFQQYKEYMVEYNEKYASYCSLYKSLESFRNEFHNLGRDLEAAKGRDVDGYYNALEQLKETYHQRGNRHKRLKKIFIVLHEELKHLKQRIKDFALEYATD